MVGTHDVVADQELLVELLGRPDLRLLDLYVAIRIRLILHTQPHQLNHLLTQFDDAYRFSHVEHEDITTLNHGPGLDHELDRLGHRYNVAIDLRMSDRHRSPITNLLKEQEHSRPGQGQHIAESSH